MKVIRWIALTIGAVLISLLVTSLFNKVSDNLSQDELKGYTEVNLSYKVGKINNDGTGVESDTSMYTEKAIKATEVKVVIDFEHNIFYQLFFYDENGDLIRASDVSHRTNVYEMPEGATHFRVMITPDWDNIEDNNNKIDLLEKYGYYSQLRIGVKTTTSSSTETE